MPAHLAHGDCIGPCLLNKKSLIGNEEEQKDEINSQKFIFEACPNPFKEVTTITFALPEADNAKLEVYNYLGQRVVTLFDNYTEAHVLYQVKFITENLREGIFLAVLQTDNERKIMRLILIK